MVTLRRALIVLAAMLCVSCRTPPTQVLVRFLTDLPLPDPALPPSEQLAGMNALQFAIDACSASGDCEERERFERDRNAVCPELDLGAAEGEERCGEGIGRFRELGSFGVVPLDVESEDGFGIRASLRLLDDEVINVSARSGFVRERSLRLDVFLSSACRGVVCPSGQTCNMDGVCVDDTVPPVELIPVDGLPAPIADGGAQDAGVDAVADVAQDISRDAVRDTAPDTTFFDATADTSLDALVDARPDARPDASLDAGSDATPPMRAGLCWPYHLARVNPPFEFSWRDAAGAVARIGGAVVSGDCDGILCTHVNPTLRGMVNYSVDYDGDRCDGSAFVAARCDFDGDGVSDLAVSADTPTGLRRLTSVHVRYATGGHRNWGFATPVPAQYGSQIACQPGSDRSNVVVAAGHHIYERDVEGELWETVVTRPDAYDILAIEAEAMVGDPLHGDLVWLENRPDAGIYVVLWDGRTGAMTDARVTNALPLPVIGAIGFDERDLADLDIGDFDADGIPDVAIGISRRPAVIDASEVYWAELSAGAFTVRPLSTARAGRFGYPVLSMPVRGFRSAILTSDRENRVVPWLLFDERPAEIVGDPEPRSTGWSWFSAVLGHDGKEVWFGTSEADPERIWSANGPLPAIREIDSITLAERSFGAISDLFNGTDSYVMRLGWTNLNPAASGNLVFNELPNTVVVRTSYNGGAALALGTP